MPLRLRISWPLLALALQAATRPFPVSGAEFGRSPYPTLVGQTTTSERDMQD
jgi:hypothetical protein